MSETKCPVCDSRQIEKGHNVCPRCKTDLSLWNQITDLPNRYYNQALQMIKANHINEAKESLTAALALYPEHFDSQLLLGKIYAELEMYEEAIVIWEKALKHSSENSREIEDLINKAKKRQDEVVTQKDEEQKRSLERVKKEEAHRIRFRWIAYSALFSVVALMIGIFLPYRYPSQVPPVTSPIIISEPVEYKQVVEEILKSQGISDIQVNQKNSIIYLSGKVLIPQEKYRLESLIQDIKGVSAVDLSGVEVLYPKGYFYTVRKGDNLWVIAERVWGNGAKFERIYQSNEQTILDPSKISPGITILIPE